MSHQLPETIWQRIKAFLVAGLTGNITLHILEGKVKGAKIEEHIKTTTTE